MTLSEIIPTLLNSLVEKRVWEAATPDDLERDFKDNIKPFIIWTIGGGQDAEYVDQTISTSTNARVQIECAATSGIVASLLMQQVRDALLASSYTVGVYGSPVGAYDALRKLHVRKQQFSIWFRQTA